MNKPILTLLSSFVLWSGCIIYDEREEEIEETNKSTVFILCEGNFGNSNAALWSFSPEDSTSETLILGGTSLGDVAQALSADDNKLYVVVNNSHKIEVLSVGEEISHEGTITFNNASPRYLVTNGTTGYVSCWNLSAILVLDLTNQSVVDTISIPGMPEKMILNGTRLYVSIPSNPDWSSANLVLEISTITKTIDQTFEVISGPNDMELIGNHLFVASTYYGANWTTFTGISKINLSTGTITSYSDGSNSVIKGDLVKVRETLYRTTSTGLASVNVDLSLNLGTILGGQTNVYSAAADDNYIYFGTTNWTAPDTVFVTDHNGLFVNEFIVGTGPGDFVTMTD